MKDTPINFIRTARRYVGGFGMSVEVGEFYVDSLAHTSVDRSDVDDDAELFQVVPLREALGDMALRNSSDYEFDCYIYAQTHPGDPTTTELRDNLGVIVRGGEIVGVRLNDGVGAERPVPEPGD